MRIIQQAFKLSPSDYYTMHLQITNAIFAVKLTAKELEVLAAFMSLDPAITKEGHFNPVARKIVRTKLNLVPAGLSNHLREMINKGFLTRNSITKVITIKTYLLPEEDGQGYQLRIQKI